VTFRYRHAKRQRSDYRTLSGTRFLVLVLQHVLPKGFRRARNLGLLHPNCQHAITLLQWLFCLNPQRLIARLKLRPQLICPFCGADMRIVQTRLPPRSKQPPLIPTREAAEALAFYAPATQRSPDFGIHVLRVALISNSGNMHTLSVLGRHVYLAGELGTWGCTSPRSPPGSTTPPPRKAICYPPNPVTISGSSNKLSDPRSLRSDD
jgi:hypothetical protein